MATNYTPATAKEITAFPYIDTVPNAALATDDLVNIPADAIGSHAYNSLWYKYTPGDDVDFIFIGTNTSKEENYTPLVTVWVGTVGSLTQYEITQGGSPAVFSSQAYGGYYLRVPVESGTTYWIQIIQDATVHAIPDVAVSLISLLAATAPAPVRSIVITDDYREFPATILSYENGAFLQYRREIPAGEFGNTQPTGEICQTENYTDKLFFLDGQLNTVAELTVTGVINVATDYAGNFYVLSVTVGTATVRKYTAAGVIVWTKVLTLSFSTAFLGFTVSRDGNHGYFTRSGSGNKTIIYDYNFGTDTQESDITVAAGIGNWTTDNIIITSDGHLNGIKQDSVTHVVNIVRYNLSTGAIVLTITPTTITYANKMCLVYDDQILLWGYRYQETNNNAIFEMFDSTTGLSVNEITSIPVTNGSVATTQVGNPNAISESCPIWVLQEALTLESSQKSGLYRKVAAKANDGYYQSFEPEDSIVLPIRDPFIVTGMFGDE